MMYSEYETLAGKRATYDGFLNAEAVYLENPVSHTGAVAISLSQTKAARITVLEARLKQTEESKQYWLLAYDRMHQRTMEAETLATQRKTALQWSADSVVSLQAQLEDTLKLQRATRAALNNVLRDMT